MLFAPRQMPMRVSGFRRNASTSTGLFAEVICNPVVTIEGSCSTRPASPLAGTIQVPGANVRAATLNSLAARDTGTFAACSRATAINAAFDSGPIK
jgi:hypothetical protein